jgi:hypothetical protein
MSIRREPSGPDSHGDIEHTQQRLRESIEQARELLDRTEQMIRELSDLLRTAKRAPHDGEAGETSSNGKSTSAADH